MHVYHLQIEITLQEIKLIIVILLVQHQNEFQSLRPRTKAFPTFLDDPNIRYIIPPATDRIPGLSHEQTTPINKDTSSEDTSSKESEPEKPKEQERPKEPEKRKPPPRGKRKPPLPLWSQCSFSSPSLAGGAGNEEVNQVKTSNTR